MIHLRIIIQNYKISAIEDNSKAAINILYQIFHKFTTLLYKKISPVFTEEIILVIIHHLLF